MSKTTEAVEEEVTEEVIETPAAEETADEYAELAAMKKELKDSLKDVAKMKEDIKDAAGMNEPAPMQIADHLNMGYDYEQPTFSEICKLVGKEFGDTMKAFAKLKTMNKEQTEAWACRSWRHIIHMQDYHEDRAIVKFKTWVRNLRNVNLTL